MKTDALKTIYLKDYTPAPFDVEAVNLKFEIFSEYTVVHSNVAYKSKSSDPQPLKLHGRELELVSVAIDGKALPATAYHVGSDYLEIPTVPAKFTLDIATKILPHKNTSLEGLYRSGGANLYTQCEAEGFRKITYFYDRPDVMSVYRVRIEADKGTYPILLSNGNCTGRGDLQGGRHFAEWKDPFKKPSYLFALVAGQLDCLRDSHVTPSGRTINLEIYAAKTDIEKCKFAMASLINSMKWDERVYGLECDLDNYMIVAVGDFNFGAMENKGLNIFNTSTVLASPETATDDTYHNVEAVVGHEYFHNWTGNRVTCRDWFQLCLKEGLTVFRDQEFSSSMGSPSVQRIDMVSMLRRAQFPEDAGPMAHPVRPSSFVEINNFYTATIYEKGAEICRMLHTILGPEGFRKGTDLYFARHDGQAVTIEDFLAALGDANGQNLGEFLMWYTQAGTPQVKGRGVYDEGKKTYTLTLDQVNPATPGQAEKQALPLPNRMALLGSDGREIPLQLVGEKSAGGRERVIMLRGATETLEFINVPHKPVPSLFRGFSAPIKLQNVYSNDDLQFLIAHDSDEFNRWDASETLLIRTILRLADDVKNKRPLQMPKGIVESYERMLSNNALGGTFRAMAVSIPSYTLLAQFLVPVDVDALVTARGFVEKELAKGLEKTLWRLVEENKQIGTYAYSVEQVGRRKLRNECLFLLGSTESPAAKKAILEQHRTANNMTDEYSALRMLADFDCQEGADAIAAFYKKWQHEKLVIDRWFSVQVASESDDSYNRLKKLVKHPDFHLTNPNRARALLGGFFQNFKQFHHESGRGYKICSEMTIALDRINPMIAARLVRVMAQWRKMDTARQGMMKAELERIQASEGLSVDTSEVVAQLLK